jgi:hypothetical protein
MSAPIFKILIDFDEYLKLMTLKEVVKKQEEELKKHYETKSIPSYHHSATQIVKSKSIENQDNKPIVSTEIKEENKIGAGATASTSAFDKGDLIKHITAEVTKTIENYYNLQPVTSAVKQEGTGADDLLLSEPIPILNDNPVFKPVNNVEIHKSRLNDTFDVKKLLDTVPAESLEKAQILIKKLDDFPNEITWDSTGNIYIDQKSLPESNIFDLFPKLFRKTPNANKIINLKELASKISSLGLGYLLNARLTSGLSRKKPLLTHDEMFLKTKANPNWWYIGNE